ncbi:hypothetical protein [Actinokineospora terrae]|uniref:Uncharacterized protein n=1 Tax=Actinokineospora terrae TaxID=155974 RepID=A0A1H9MAP8_9PSEU|nr:hypothetical protein [Actinokineospora terrae]SER20766.1 hypothetical protein SAMN04487818_10259 [Actinokineospora terrae]
MSGGSVERASLDGTRSATRLLPADTRALLAAVTGALADAGDHAAANTEPPQRQHVLLTAARARLRATLRAEPAVAALLRHARLLGVDLPALVGDLAVPVQDIGDGDRAALAGVAVAGRARAAWVVGDLLAALRNGREWTRPRLAARVDSPVLPAGRIGDLESGVVTLYLGDLHLLCRALDVPPAAVLAAAETLLPSRAGLLPVHAHPDSERPRPPA